MKTKQKTINKLKEIMFFDRTGQFYAYGVDYPNFLEKTLEAEIEDLKAIIDLINKGRYGIAKKLLEKIGLKTSKFDWEKSELFHDLNV